MATTTADVVDRRSGIDVSFGPLALAGVASLGAGAVHAAAIGVHTEHQAAVRTFADVAAMYMLRTGDTLDDVPELGGDLTQWHIHDNLCYSLDPKAPKVAGLTDGEGNCRPGLQKLQPVPMIHVWITKHPCGPFAALEGVGAGQIKDGEERLCDEAHGH